MLSSARLLGQDSETSAFNPNPIAPGFGWGLFLFRRHVLTKDLGRPKKKLICLNTTAKCRLSILPNTLTGVLAASPTKPKSAGP